MSRVKHHILQNLPIFQVDNIPYVPLNIPSTPLNILSAPLNIPSTPLTIPSTPLNIPSAPLNIPSAPLNILSVLCQVRQDLLPGDSQLTNSTYFDNSSLELYHGRLDKRPNAIAVRFRWSVVFSLYEHTN